MVENRYAQPNELRSQPARSLLLRLFNDLTSLANQDYQLVKTELAQQRGVLERAAWSAGLAAAFGLVALMCLTSAAVAELSVFLGLPLAALIAGVVFVVVAVLLGLALRRTVSEGALSVAHIGGRFLPKSRATSKSLEDQEADIAWTRRRIDETLTALEHKSDLGQPLRDTAVGMGALGVAVANIVREGQRTAR